MVEPKKSVVNEDFNDDFDFKLFAVESSFRISFQVLCVVQTSFGGTNQTEDPIILVSPDLTIIAAAISS